MCVCVCVQVYVCMISSYGIHVIQLFTFNSHMYISCLHIGCMIYALCSSSKHLIVSSCLVCVSSCLVCVSSYLVCVSSCLVCVSSCLVCVSSCLVCVSSCLVCVSSYLVCVSSCVLMPCVCLHALCVSCCIELHPQQIMPGRSCKLESKLIQETFNVVSLKDYGVNGTQ